MGFFSVGRRDAEESAEMMDTAAAVSKGQLYRRSPFLLQSCRRAFSFVEQTKVQSYELLGREDNCHTKHWISFI